MVLTYMCIKLKNKLNPSIQTRTHQVQMCFYQTHKETQIIWRHTVQMPALKLLWKAVKCKWEKSYNSFMDCCSLSQLTEHSPTEGSVSQCVRLYACVNKGYSHVLLSSDFNVLLPKKKMTHGKHRGIPNWPYQHQKNFREKVNTCQIVLTAHQMANVALHFANLIKSWIDNHQF